MTETQTSVSKNDSMNKGIHVLHSNPNYTPIL